MTDREIRDKRLAAVLAGHPALLLTAGYLLIPLLGLSFESTLFGQFGVNFFYFAEVTDLLVGAFREPITSLLSAAALLVGWLTYLWNKAEWAWLEKRPAGGWFLERNRGYADSRFNRHAPVTFLIGCSIMVIWLHGECRADELREGEVSRMTVVMAGGSEPRPLQLLGTSSRFVFFYRVNSDETVIASLESIASISADAGGP